MRLLLGYGANLWWRGRVFYGSRSWLRAVLLLGAGGFGGAGGSDSGYASYLEYWLVGDGPRD